jgi:hypothetical protein
MTKPVISNPSAVLRINSVRDLSPALFSKESSKDTKRNRNRREQKLTKGISESCDPGSFNVHG